MILDTDILVALLRADPAANRAIEKLHDTGEEIATTALTAYELLRGARVSLDWQQNLLQVKARAPARANQHRKKRKRETLRGKIKACPREADLKILILAVAIPIALANVSPVWLKC